MAEASGREKEEAWVRVAEEASVPGEEAILVEETGEKEGEEPEAEAEAGRWITRSRLRSEM